MARPRRSEQRMPIDEQLKQALFDCIIGKGFAETHVSDITEIVGCNRGTFYYYYKDLYELRDAVIDDNLPLDLPRMIFNLFLSRNGVEAGLNAESGLISEVHEELLASAEINGVSFGHVMHEGIRANSEKIDATALLLNSDIGDTVSKRIESHAIGIWGSLLGLQEEDLDTDVRVILEFLIGGLLKLMAFRAQNGFKDDIFDMVESLAPEVPVALFACLDKAMPKKSQNAAQHISTLC